MGSCYESYVIFHILWNFPPLALRLIEHSPAYTLPDDLSTFTTIYTKLLPSSPSLRHIPIRFYLPSTDAQRTDSPKPPSSPDPSAPSPKPASGHIKVIQSLVEPWLPTSREPQTLGNALHSVLPSLFPSRRTPILARPVLHGAVVPMSAPVEHLMRGAVYADGWISCGVEMIG